MWDCYVLVQVCLNYEEKTRKKNTHTKQTIQKHFQPKKKRMNTKRVHFFLHSSDSPGCQHKKKITHFEGAVLLLLLLLLLSLSSTTHAKTSPKGVEVSALASLEIIR